MLSSDRMGWLRFKWVKGMTIPYAGRVFTDDEVAATVSSTLDFWLSWI